MDADLYKYGRYIYKKQETRWATIDEIKGASTYVDLSSESYPVGGLPLISVDGREAYVDGKDTHSLIFGATGSKKTRLFCMPLINILAGAGESFVATDPKGELYEKTSGFVKSKGYNIVVLNFRELGFGDMWNPLGLVYDLYHSGKKDEAMILINDFVSSISEEQIRNTKEPYWPEMAANFALANLMLMVESATKEEMNVLSLSRLCSSECGAALNELSALMAPDSIAGMNYKGVFTAPDRTRASIFVSLYGMVGKFNTHRTLARMLSGNTVDIKKFGKEKTAVYIIVPDEKTSTHFLVTTFVKQVYEILISEAQNEPNNKLPVRVNFVLDEFCNIPTVPDMPCMISAARSRNMRFFLVIQSIHQLKGKYHEDADTIKGNCDNWVFLTTKELSLLEEVSALCGSLVSVNGKTRRLISVSELQRFDKEKGEALIMHCRQYPIITDMVDIDSYEVFKGYPSVPLEPFMLPEVKVFSPEKLLEDIGRGTRQAPFSRKDFETDLPDELETAKQNSASVKPEHKGIIMVEFDALFGTDKKINE